MMTPDSNEDSNSSSNNTNNNSNSTTNDNNNKTTICANNSGTTSSSSTITSSNNNNNDNLCKNQNLIKNNIKRKNNEPALDELKSKLTKRLTSENEKTKLDKHDQIANLKLNQANNCIDNQNTVTNSNEYTNWLNIFRDWPNQKKLNALAQLIEQCEYNHIKHVHNLIDPKLKRDYISELPREIALLILSYLQAKDLSKLAQVSHYWNQLADDCIIWKKLCSKNKIKEINELTSSTTTTTADSATALALVSSSNSNTQICKSTVNIDNLFRNLFKKSYVIDYNVKLNWTTRTLPKPLVLKGHDDHVITCLKFDGSRIVSGSDDCTLKIWCANTGQLLQTLTGHSGGVWSSQLKGDLLISGSTDRSVRVWRLDTGECVHCLTGHTSTVRCLALFNNIVVSGSRDATLRVWNLDTGKCVNILRGHTAAVRCVCYDGNYIISGSYDFTIRVWKANCEKSLHVLEGHMNRVYSLLFDGKRIVSGSLDTTIIVWDVETGRIIHKLTGHQSLTSGMQIKGDILVSGNADSTVKIWSLKTGFCMHTLCGDYKHLSAVTCLVFNEKFVVSSSDDGTVKLWNIETGEFIRNLLTLESGGHGGVVWRISMAKNKLVCAVGSRMGTEETKLLVFDFDWPAK